MASFEMDNGTDGWLNEERRRSQKGVNDVTQYK